MIFAIRLLVEKSWVHSAEYLITIIDLKKAYSSVPRSVMWLALGKLQSKLIRSFHQGMEARIRLDGALHEEFSVENGLTQGSCMAQVPFNLYKCLVIEYCHARVEDVGRVGVNLRYKYDHKLFRQYTRNAV